MSIVSHVLRASLCAAAASLTFAAHSAFAQERLIFTSLSPAGSDNSAFFNAWAQRVNERSNGALKIEVRDGLTLAHFGNMYDRVQNDVVQIGWAIHQVVAGKFPLSEVAGLPFVSSGGPEASLALYRLHKSGLLDEEYSEVVPLIFSVFGAAQLHFGKAPASTQDLSSLKVGVAGKVPSQMVAQLGGTPISMRPEDWYETLQRGTVDAGITSWAAFVPYRLQEVTSFHLEAPLGQSTSMFFMSRKRFDALSPEARKALEEVAAESTTREFGTFFFEQWEKARARVVADSKHKIVQMNQTQVEAWQAKAQPVLAEWVNGQAGRDKALEAYRNFYAEEKSR